jgi:UDP-N-acetylglucosamine--N-acetylmuramyl-(pentapeptide) pyrophosphoryl-undecaprenol N-acetylglucosamine transferase
VPAGLIAWRNRTPLILLEQNVIPGRATSLLAPFADQMCVSFDATTRHLRSRSNVVVTGNPVRQEIARMARPSPKDSNRNARVLLVLGGSQGAAGLNSMVLSSAGRLRHRLHGWRIVHQTGERDAARIRAAYRQLSLDADVAPYFDDLPRRYAEAQLVISRAGATTLAELACCGLPAILVPYPNSARDHQAENARFLEEAGATFTIPEEPNAASRLAHRLSSLIDDDARLAEMSAAIRKQARPSAAAIVADTVLQHFRTATIHERRHAA